MPLRISLNGTVTRSGPTYWKRLLMPQGSIGKHPRSSRGEIRTVEMSDAVNTPGGRVRRARS
jgi:hypothetical protein